MKAIAPGILAILVLVASPPRDGRPPETADPATRAAATATAATAAASEAERVALHLRHAERHLEAVDPSHLTAEQRQARRAAIERLREYRLRGEFPRNLDFTHPMPYFIDDRGVPCAMAYLIGQAGGEALVTRVAATANNAFIRDLAADPELQDWLDRNGMTTAEAALIQPWYGETPPQPEPDRSLLADARHHYGAVGTATMAADALALYLLNADDRYPLGRGFLAVLAGTAGTAFAVSVLDHGGTRTQEALAIANIAAGITTAALGVRGLRRTEPDEPATPTATTGTTIGVAPAVIPGSGLRPGVALTLRF